MDSDQKLAMKIFNDSGQQAKEIQNEKNILLSLKNEFIIKMIDSFLYQENCYLITEFCENGDLAVKIKATKDLDKTIDDVLILKWTKQIIKAIDYLHNSIEPKCIHRDIKPGYA